MKTFIPVCFLLLLSYSGLAQSQVCPANNNWSFGDLTHWQAYTGNNSSGNGATAVKQTYDSSLGAPSGTLGVSQIAEYTLPSTLGIQVLSASTIDPFGGFATVPTINGYKYTNSLLLGSTAITRSSNGGTGGGYVRGVSFLVDVPPGAPGTPYTMTYAYAMVLENGTHNSNDQPLFSATLRVDGTVVECASPQYFLPTFDNGGTRNIGATLDTALAKSQGFKLSPRLSPNDNVNGAGPGRHLQDVWYKGWTEVTFDLGPYRGKTVSLTFETDNCVPGGHFAYSYIALRNVCDGLQISGPQSACLGSDLTYSIPALAGASYTWQVPPGWTIVSGADSNILKVQATGTPGTAGTISVEEKNSCADLNATLNVKTVPPTVAGAVARDAEVCSGTNSTHLDVTGNTGDVLNWLSTTDGVHYTNIANTTTAYDANNLTTTTSFVAVIQNGESCLIDTAAAAKVTVDPQTVGGSLSPSSFLFCLNQDKDALLKLTGQVGTSVNWQSSPDGSTWTDLAPPNPDSVYEIPPGLTTSTYYRVRVQSGVCPEQPSAPAVVNIVNTPFPQATTEPADTLICYNSNATLNATITIGTSYSWNNTNTLSGQGDGTITSLPTFLSATASPKSTTNYVLNVENAGCPNPLKDTFHVRVYQPIIVDAGNDTSVVVNEPLQLHVSSNDTSAAGDTFTWTPSLGLDNPNIADPIGIYSAETDSIRYFVTATSIAYGCTGVGEVLVKIFKTGPDIFVPNAFTPGNATNRVFRPIPVGITALQYFRIYNRWGQLVYSTSRIGDGWDGMQNGRPLPPGSYVWMVQGTTYTNHTVFHKGVMVLVR